MGADTPAEGGENKPTIKVEKTTSGRRGNNKPARRGEFLRKEKFMGANPNLQGYVFEPKNSRTSQVANFERVDERIRMQIGADFHHCVLESIETGTKVLPPEPTLIKTGGGIRPRPPRRTR